VHQIKKLTIRSSTCPPTRHIKLGIQNKNIQWKKGLNKYRSELGSIYYTYDMVMLLTKFHLWSYFSFSYTKIKDVGQKKIVVS